MMLASWTIYSNEYKNRETDLWLSSYPAAMAALSWVNDILNDGVE
jgi:hypothetical protein